MQTEKQNNKKKEPAMFRYGFRTGFALLNPFILDEPIGIREYMAIFSQKKN